VSTSSGRYRKEIERQQSVRKRTEELKHADAASEARAIWKQSTPATSHAYLERKQVKPHGIRLHGERLVVPMSCDTYIYSLQFITDKTKLFHKGGRVAGLYLPIGAMTNRYGLPRDSPPRRLRTR
jgi:putative DNA primase/helicase